MTATKDSGDVVPAYPRALRSLWVGALVLPRRQKRSRPVSIAPFCVNGEFHDFMTVPYFHDRKGFDVEIQYFRDRAGREVDFLATLDRRPWLRLRQNCAAQP